MSDLRFDPKAEQYVAAVYYVAKHATEQYVKHKDKNLSRFWFLAKIQRLLGLERETISYGEMRYFLTMFVESFGVTK